MKQRAFWTAGLIGSAVVALLLAVPSAAVSGGKEKPSRHRSAWKTVVEHAEWEGRAGLQAVALGHELLVMGGRGPFSPFGTQIFQDVWSSSDLGQSWRKVSDPAEWPARSYFQALRRGDEVYVLGGQNFDVVPNPGPCPPFGPCFPFIPRSTFFNDVWKSDDGANWTEVTAAAPWEGRAGLSAVVFRGRFYVFGGSQGDDASTGGQGRRLFNDVWVSDDGASWTEVTPAAMMWLLWLVSIPAKDRGWGTGFQSSQSTSMNLMGHDPEGLCRTSCVAGVVDDRFLQGRRGLPPRARRRARRSRRSRVPRATWSGSS